MAHQRRLIDLGAQFRCDNNSGLSYAWKRMQPRGRRSEVALHRAKPELLTGGLIFEAPMGPARLRCAVENCAGGIRPMVQCGRALL